MKCQKKNILIRLKKKSIVFVGNTKIYFAKLKKSTENLFLQVLTSKEEQNATEFTSFKTSCVSLRTNKHLYNLYLLIDSNDSFFIVKSA